MQLAAWGRTMSQMIGRLLNRAGLRGARGTWLLIGAMWTLVFLGDLLLRMDVAVSVLYLIPIALTLWIAPSPAHARRTVNLLLLTLAATVVCALFGADPQHAPGPRALAELDQAALANRLVGAIAQVVTALIVIRQQRTRALEHEMIARLKQALRSSGEFVAVASHELKTPLTGARGYAQLLLRRARRGQIAGLDGQSAEALRLIDDLLSRLNLLADDLLHVSRLDSGRFDIQRARLDTATTARRVADDLARQAPRHTIQVHTVGEVGDAYADDRRVEQVLTNLIGNAVKYSPVGGLIEVTLAEAPGSMLAAPSQVEWHTARTDRRQILVSVRDEGIGIPDAERARLFQRFARAANAADLDIPGTGLGLYLCRALIEAQGGRIWLACSELGRGSTFSFTLPAWQAMPSPTMSLPGVTLAHTPRH